MKPEVTNEDCMEMMKRYPDGFFDLAVVDPPYGIGIDGQKKDINNANPKHNRKAHDFKGWDKSIPDEAYFRELERVTKNQIIWGGNYFVRYLNNGTKGWVIWDKGQKGLTMSDCEIAYSSFNKPTRIKVLNRVELLKEGTIHPTQKPVQLYRWILHNYAEPGQKILDTHLGSGSSRIAAHMEKMHFWGCELDTDYFEAQEKRFKQHISQTTLF